MSVSKAAIADGYIRVSRRGGREGESFISPEVQRAKIEGWAKLHGVEIVAWWEEIDQSGAKRERPMFQEALGRCERRETGGIVVARLDRFARSAIDALESIKRLNEAGARLVSVEDNFDGSKPMGRFAIGILTLLAELELERIKEGWQTAISKAVDRGVHISARPPTGYARDEAGRLRPVEPAASAVKEVFRRRAVGASWADLARFLEEQEVFPPTGNPGWSKAGVAGLVKNPVYLGEARSGSMVKKKAHPAVVTRAEFDAAQSTKKSVLAPRDGSIASQALLGGLARCAGCGHTLKVTGTTKRSTGERYPVYYCVGRYASGACPARANAAAPVLDSYVEAQVLAALNADDGPVAEAVQASAELETAAAAVTAAEHELDLFVTNTTLLTLLGETKFIAGVQSRQHAIDQARSALAPLRGKSELAVELSDGRLIQTWPNLMTAEKRQLLHGLLQQVTVTRAEGRGRHANSIADRTEILLRGGSHINETRQSPTKDSKQARGGKAKLKRGRVRAT
jgi:DNA invertase Pin-like site-specific DNA recombinase